MRRATIAFFVLLTAAIAAADDFSYVFTGTGKALISGSMDIDSVLAIRKRYAGDYLWARWKGGAYLIRDAATIAEARAAFAEADALHDDYERLARRMRPLEAREEELEKQIDRIGDAISDGEIEDDALEAKMEKQLRELEAKMKPVSRELRELEREEEILDAREEKVIAVAEAELRRIVDRAVARGIAERVR